MSKKKPKFLKSAAELNKQASVYGHILSRRKKGITDDFYMTTPELRYFCNKLSKMARDDSTMTENFERQIAYNEAFLAESISGKSPFQAKLAAQSKVRLPNNSKCQYRLFNVQLT